MSVFGAGARRALSLFREASSDLIRAPSDFASNRLTVAAVRPAVMLATPTHDARARAAIRFETWF